MLWELKKLEERRREIELEILRINQEKTLWPKRKAARIAELHAEDTRLSMRRDVLLSLISQDRMLSKELDKERELESAEALARRQEALQQTELHSSPAAQQRRTLQSHMRKWHEKSVTDRNTEASRVLEQEQENGWERD